MEWYSTDLNDRAWHDGDVVHDDGVADPHLLHDHAARSKTHSSQRCLVSNVGTRWYRTTDQLEHSISIIQPIRSQYLPGQLSLVPENSWRMDLVLLFLQSIVAMPVARHSVDPVAG